MLPGSRNHVTKHPKTCHQAPENMLPGTRKHGTKHPKPGNVVYKRSRTTSSGSNRCIRFIQSAAMFLPHPFGFVEGACRSKTQRSRSDRSHVAWKGLSRWVDYGDTIARYHVCCQLTGRRPPLREWLNLPQVHVAEEPLFSKVHRTRSS